MKKNNSALIIEVEREAYSLKDCYKTMTVGELKELLECYDEDTPIYLSHDRGYTYGGIREENVEHIEDLDECQAVGEEDEE